MLRIGSLKLDKVIRAVSYFMGLPLAGLYLIAMVFYPFINGDWAHVQSVWDRWQSLNVGILAFASSVIAFNISIFNARRQKEREFIAAKAFLPEALSSLCLHLRSHKPLLMYALAITQEKPPQSPYKKIKPPHADYKEVFSRCISLATPEMGDHLADILRMLQINGARMTSLPKELREHSQTVVCTKDILGHLYFIAELYAKINMTFDFARGGSDFKSSRVSTKQMTEAYLGLEIDPSSVKGLQEYTKMRMGHQF